jgi:ABC-type transport system involved in cytochrome c biogenesis permease subunit
MAFIDGITLFCIGASYSVALAVELVHLLWPRGVQRLIGTGFGAAGLLAHTLLLARGLFLADTRLTLETPYGSMLFVAWILAVFYVFGSVHHHQWAWGIFILPVVLGLIILAGWFGPGSKDPTLESTWGYIHGGLMLLAAVGVCVGFFASLMYLVQARRLRAKALPGQGIRLPSLERLEDMNRRALLAAFPLLTAGLLVGMGRLVQQADKLADWGYWKVSGTLILWVVFAILLYLRHAAHLRGRRVALLTIVAFVLLMFTLASAHPEVGPS